MKNGKIFLFTVMFVSLTFLLYGQNASDFEVQGKMLVKYNGTATDVVIPTNLGINMIGEEAFCDSEHITSIIIPAGVTYIGDSAFSGCKSLKNITIPAGVTYIGDSVFSECSSLQSITIPAGVTSIGDNAFSGCKSLKNINLPVSVTSIGDEAFMGCGSLAVITIPESVKSIGVGVFDDCKSLTMIITDEKNAAYTSIDGILYNKSKTKIIRYPQGKQRQNYTVITGVTTIGWGAFNGCSNLNNITIPAGVVIIEGNAFARCESLTDIQIPSSVTSIGDNSFAFCSNLKVINISDKVNSIGNRVFDYCEKLTRIIVDEKNTAYSSSNGVLFNKAKTKIIRYPEGKQEQNFAIPVDVTSIGWGTFFACSNLINISIPSGVTSIEDGAFFFCENLVSIIIPAGIKNIGMMAFHCNSLNSVTFKGTIPSSEFNNTAFAFGDLRDKFYATDKTNGTPGTYTRESGGEVWTKQ